MVFLETTLGSTPLLCAMLGRLSQSQGTFCFFSSLIFSFLSTHTSPFSPSPNPVPPPPLPQHLADDEAERQEHDGEGDEDADREVGGSDNDGEGGSDNENEDSNTAVSAPVPAPAPVSTPRPTKAPRHSSAALPLRGQAVLDDATMATASEASMVSVSSNARIFMERKHALDLRQLELQQKALELKERQLILDEQKSKRETQQLRLLFKRARK